MKLNETMIIPSNWTNHISNVENIILEIAGSDTKLGFSGLIYKIMIVSILS